MVLTVSFVLFPGTGLFAPVIARIATAQLGISVGMPEPHDFAVRIEIVRPRAKRALRSNASIASRAQRS